MPAVAPDPEYPSDDWLFDEDRALRDLMKGMIVTDIENRERKVEAWFGHPDQELREQKYPYITVDLVNIQEGLDRVHRGFHYLADPPAWWKYPPLTGSQVGYLIEMPTPVDLDYQIASWARNPRHDRQILNQLITWERIPLRGGQLSTADGKIRRLDVLGHNKRDIVETGKRLLTNIFRVRVSSEYPWDRLRSTDFIPHPVFHIYIEFMRIVKEGNLHLDDAYLTTGQIVAWDVRTRRADLKVLDTDNSVITLSNVPASSRSGDFLKDDAVSVVRMKRSDGGFNYLILESLHQMSPSSL